MNVLDSCYKPDMLCLKDWQNLFKNRDIKVHLPRLADDAGPVLDRRVAEVNEHIGEFKGVEGKIACPVAGIPIDDHLKSGIP